jgi:hypothetical protein
MRTRMQKPSLCQSMVEDAKILTHAFETAARAFETTPPIRVL